MAKDLQSLKVAIVHDWLYGGGAELVVEQLHKMFPDARIYTSYCNDEWRARLDNKVVTGFLQHWPFDKLRKFVPFLRIWWFTHLDLSGYDLVISSSGAEAKGVKVPQNTVHINYCHAPTHYYWSRYDEYMEHPGFGKFDFIARLGLKFLVAPLRKWDYKAAQRPHHIIANSTHIQREIKKYYNRDSTVVFPPVAFERYEAFTETLPRKGFVVAGRHTPYKRLDLAIQACTELNLPLTVLGTGPDTPRLKSLAGPNVTFLGRVSDEELVRQFASAEALIFPGLDDFGITPVEAMAAGTPVIAYKAGGALDYVIPGTTGEFFAEPTLQSLKNVLRTYNASSYQKALITKTAQRFSAQTFRESITKYLRQTIGHQPRS